MGNSIKDVFLKLDERKNRAETDENDTPWINLGFSGQTYEFMRHTAVTAGAAVTKEILTNFGIRSQIIGEGQSIPAVEDYRYILNMDEDKVAYFSSSQRIQTVWREPESVPAWILIDRSAEMTEDLMRSILAYMDKNPKVRLAIYVSKETKAMETPLVARAKVIFAENNDWVASEDSLSVEVGKSSLSVAGKSVHWWTRRSDLMTHLTVNTIATTTFFAAMLRGEKTDTALKMARMAVETATLSSNLTYSKMKQLIELESQEKTDLGMIAKMLFEGGRGILAADESGGSIHRKFEEAGIADTAEIRRTYRNIFLGTENLEQYVNGVILFDETAHQLADNGQNFVSYLSTRGIIPGIKVDEGLEPIEGLEPSENHTKGLASLPERLRRYQEMGLRFAKWRAAFEVSSSLPSEEAIEKNCAELAAYARLCQQADIVPIVEPEVVHDGNFSLRRCAIVTEQVLKCLFRHLAEEEVQLPACILKVNMVLAGKQYSIRSTASEVGRETVKLLASTVPSDLAGVVFLSGGQTPAEATENLRAIYSFAGTLPFPVSFSFARAVQEPALEAWHGDDNNIEAARAAFVDRIRQNVL